jgi:hypothetical protein
MTPRVTFMMVFLVSDRPKTAPRDLPRRTLSARCDPQTVLVGRV